MWSPVCSDIRMRRLYAMPKSSSFFSPWNRTTKRETPKSGSDCQALTKFILASSRFRSLTFACASKIFCRNCKTWVVKFKTTSLWQINHTTILAYLWLSSSVKPGCNIIFNSNVQSWRIDDWLTRRMLHWKKSLDGFDFWIISGIRHGFTLGCHSTSCQPSWILSFLQIRTLQNLLF